MERKVAAMTLLSLKQHMLVVCSTAPKSRHAEPKAIPKLLPLPSHCSYAGSHFYLLFQHLEMALGRLEAFYRVSVKFVSIHAKFLLFVCLKLFFLLKQCPPKFYNIFKYFLNYLFEWQKSLRYYIFPSFFLSLKNNQFNVIIRAVCNDIYA